MRSTCLTCAHMMQGEFQVQFAKRLKIDCSWGSACSLSQGGGGGGRPWGKQQHAAGGTKTDLSIISLEDEPSDCSDCEFLDLDSVSQRRGHPDATSSALVGSRSSSRGASPTSFFAAFVPKQEGDSVPTMILYRSPSPAHFDLDDMSMVSFTEGRQHGSSLTIYSRPQRRPFLREPPPRPRVDLPSVHAVRRFTSCCHRTGLFCNIAAREIERLELKPASIPDSRLRPSVEHAMCTSGLVHPDPAAWTWSSSSNIKSSFSAPRSRKKRGGGSSNTPYHSGRERAVEQDHVPVSPFAFVPFKSLGERYKIWDAFSKTVSDDGVVVFGDGVQPSVATLDSQFIMSLD